MYGVEALPLLHALSRSENAQDRAVFTRVYLDVVAECARRRGIAPQDWRDAWRDCLVHAGSRERALYLDLLAGVEAGANRKPARASPFAFATGEEIDALVAAGRLEDLIALAADGKARLRPDHYDGLVARAVALSREGDRRLAGALLSRAPLRLAAAPLFLEADSEQRAAILLAAQRADLGRKPSGVTLRLREDVANRLEFAAIAGDEREFAEALGAALGADPGLAGRIAADPAGEPLALALIALGAPRDLAVRILTARDLRDDAGFARIHALARLNDHISAAAVRRIVAALIQRAPAFPASAPAPAAARDAPHPSPFLRREAQPRSASRPGGDLARSA